MAGQDTLGGLPANPDFEDLVRYVMQYGDLDRGTAEDLVSSTPWPRYRHDASYIDDLMRDVVDDRRRGQQEGRQDNQGKLARARKVAGLLGALGIYDGGMSQAELLGNKSTNFADAVARYQRRYEINAGNGLIDDETFRHVNSALNFIASQNRRQEGPPAPAGTPNAVASPDRSNPDQVRRTQQQLRDAGFDPGPIDGIWGPRTQSAYDAWTRGGQTANPASARTVSAGGGAAPTAPAALAAVSPSYAMPSTVPPNSPQDLRSRVLRDFPAFAYLLDEPEIAGLLQEAVDTGFTSEQFAVRLYGTEWWKSRSESVRRWEAQLQTDPGTARARVDSMLVQISNATQRLGFTLSDAEAQTMADSALRFNWSEQQMQQAIAKALQARQWSGGLPAGEAAFNADSLGRVATSYGVRVPRETLEQYAVGIVAGTSSPESFQSYVTKLAKEQWAYDPDVIRAIDEGITPKAFFAPHAQAIADILELSPEEVDVFNDPVFSQVTQYWDPELKQRRGMTKGEAAQLAREDPRFKKTQAWRQGGASLATNLLRWTGKAA